MKNVNNVKMDIIYIKILHVVKINVYKIANYAPQYHYVQSVKKASISIHKIRLSPVSLVWKIVKPVQISILVMFVNLHIIM